MPIPDHDLPQLRDPEGTFSMGGVSIEGGDDGYEFGEIDDDGAEIAVSPTDAIDVLTVSATLISVVTEMIYETDYSPAEIVGMLAFVVFSERDNGIGNANIEAVAQALDIKHATAAKHLKTLVDMGLVRKVPGVSAQGRPVFDYVWTQTVR